MRDKEAKLILEAMSRRDFLDRLGKGIATVSKLSGLQLPTTPTPVAAISPDARYIESHFYVLGGRLHYYASTSMRTYGKHIAPNLDSITTAPGGVFVDNSLFDKLSQSATGAESLPSQRRGSLFFPYSMLMKWTESGKSMDAAMNDFLLTIFGQPPMTPRQIAGAKKAREKRFAKAQAQASQDRAQVAQQRKEREKKKKPTFPKYAIYDPDYDPDWGYPESKQLTFKQFFNEADDMSRRGFLGTLGRGAATFAAVPWTKLLSSPALISKVAAPFKIGAGSMLNPQSLFKHYRGQFKDRITDSGIEIVNMAHPKPKYSGPDWESERKAYYSRTEVDIRSVNWVSKGMVDMYAGGKKDPHDEATLAPTVAQWDNMIGYESLLEDPNFPDWAKDLLARGMAHSQAEDEEPGSGKMSDEDFKRFEALMDSSYYDEDPAGDNFDYEEEEMEDMLRSRSGAPDNVKWLGSSEPPQGGDIPMQRNLNKHAASNRAGKDLPGSAQWQHMVPLGWKSGEDNELIGSVFDYIINLKREGIGFEQLRKMNFEREFLPQVGNYVRKMVVAHQALGHAHAQQSAAADAQKAKDELQKDQLPKRPGQPDEFSDDVNPNVEWWAPSDFEWWSRRDDVIAYRDMHNSDKIELYKNMADKIIENPFDHGLHHFNGLMLPAQREAKIKNLKQQADEWLKQYHKIKDSIKPNQAHIKHPYGVGSPQSALQTMSNRPSFKEFFAGPVHEGITDKAFIMLAWSDRGMSQIKITSVPKVDMPAVFLTGLRALNEDGDEEGFEVMEPEDLSIQEVIEQSGEINADLTLTDDDFLAIRQDLNGIKEALDQEAFEDEDRVNVTTVITKIIDDGVADYFEFQHGNHMEEEPGVIFFPTDPNKWWDIKATDHVDKLIKQRITQNFGHGSSDPLIDPGNESKHPTFKDHFNKY